MLIATSIVGNEKNRYLAEWLDNVASYADKHIIIDDGSTDGTKEILQARENHQKCELIVQYNEENLFIHNELELRTKLWELTRQYAKPGDWIIVVDADEFYDNEMVQRKEELLKREEETIAFRLLDMWNEREYRIDGYWSPYFVRMFKYQNLPYEFKGNGFHLPGFPLYAWISNKVFNSEIRCIHKSYISEEEKKKKYDFYLKSPRSEFDKQHALSILDVKPELKEYTEERIIPKTLITSLIRNREWILEDFLYSLEKSMQKEFSYLFIVNNSTDRSLEILKEWKRRFPPIDIQIIEYEFEDMTDYQNHKWNPIQLQHMAKMRNLTLDKAKEGGFEYLISIDSDLIFKPEVLKHLLFSDKKIISPTFWANWKKDGTEGNRLPQTWERGGYEISENFNSVLKQYKALFRVGGLGAFTCIHRSVWEKGVNYTRVYNLPTDMNGEDRDFCTRASVHDFSLWASTYHKVLHMDNPDILELYKQTEPEYFKDQLSLELRYGIY